jgi:hypothetical protein
MAFQLKGLEVLDRMQQELEGSNCPSGLHFWVYQYVLVSGDSRDNKLFQPLGWYCLVYMSLRRVFHHAAFSFQWSSHYTQYLLPQLYYQP